LDILFKHLNDAFVPQLTEEMVNKHLRLDETAAGKTVLLNVDRAYKSKIAMAKVGDPSQIPILERQHKMVKAKLRQEFNAERSKRYLEERKRLQRDHIIGQGVRVISIIGLGAVTLGVAGAGAFMVAQIPGVNIASVFLYSYRVLLKKPWESLDQSFDKKNESEKRLIAEHEAHFYDDDEGAFKQFLRERGIH
jgi:hypothetical protein